MVACAMVVGFCVIMMKFTGFWPCRIAEVFQVDSITCTKSFGENIDSIKSWIQTSLNLHYVLLSPHNT